MTSYILDDYKGNCLHINNTLKFAHRGYIDEYPENSHESIMKAFNNGIISEFDLRLTADDEIVLFHDSNIKYLSISGEDKYINNMNLSDIEDKILISDGITKSTHIATFKKVLKTICRLDNFDNLFLDLKTDFPPTFDKDDKLVHVMYENLMESNCSNKKINYIIASSNPIILNTASNLFYSKYKHLGSLTTLWILGNSGYSIIDIFIYLLLRSRLWFYVFMNSPPNSVGFFYEFYVQHNKLMDTFRNDLGICTAFGINHLKTYKHGKTALDVNYNITVNLIIDHYDPDIWTQIIQKRYKSDPYVHYNGDNVKSIFVLFITMFMAVLIHLTLQIV